MGTLTTPTTYTEECIKMGKVVKVVKVACSIAQETSRSMFSSFWAFVQ